jgi:C1A family cysteine protease
MNYGWLRDRLDPRDHHWELSLEERLTPLPAEWSLRDAMPPVYNQGQLGSCTANAIGACVEYQEMKEHQPAVTPSRLFIYWNERNLEGHVSTDSGAQIRDGMKVVSTFGAPPESDWPYDVTRFAVEPPAQAYVDARKHEALYGRVTQSAHSFQASTFFRRPVVFGFAVFESFETIGADGVMPLPDPSREKLLGGHAVVIVGYRPINGQLYFEVRNSWGDGWGDQGYFWMPAVYAVSPQFCSDFWHIDFES